MSAEPAPPIVGAAVWTPVMRSAGYRCQCAGSCGRKHTDGGGRCHREHSPRDGHRLLAAPAEVTLSPTRAAALPTTGLRAWCPACLNATTAATHRAERHEPTTELFDVAPLRRPAGRGRR